MKEVDKISISFNEDVESFCKSRAEDAKPWVFDGGECDVKKLFYKIFFVGRIWFACVVI